MSSGALEVVLSYMKVAQQARRSQRDDDWQHVSELLAEDVVWQFAGNGIGELWRGLRGRADVLAALQVSQNNWSRLQTEAVNAFAAGDQVLLEQESTVLAEDGAKGVKPVAFVFVVADGGWPGSAPTGMTAAGLADRRGARRPEETSWPCRISPTWLPTAGRPSSRRRSLHH